MISITNIILSNDDYKYAPLSIIEKWLNRGK